ncbi:unnamed protein product [Wuchereria bancrofti]|uniref:Uncharacterized protein n=1 Tax=Wuchereria bancrofti TaxID=6293 RepID=A0A3P7DKQ2_WUCBA|nr:unnamed protein product [Wuchereria bancrofti]
MDEHLQIIANLSAAKFRDLSAAAKATQGENLLKYEKQVIKSYFVAYILYLFSFNKENNLN